MRVAIVICIFRRVLRSNKHSLWTMFSHTGIIFFSCSYGCTFQLGFFTYYIPRQPTKSGKYEELILSFGVLPISGVRIPAWCRSALKLKLVLRDLEIVKRVADIPYLNLDILIIHHHHLRHLQKSYVKKLIKS